MAKAINDAVRDYWAEHYVGGNRLCLLCGNSGIVDTTESAVSPQGSPVGCRTFCICPNGQSMRSHGQPLVTWTRCGYDDAEQYRSRTRTGSIGLEGPWSEWFGGRPERPLANQQYEYRKLKENGNG